MSEAFRRWVSEQASEALKADLEGWQNTNPLEAKTAEFWITRFMIANLEGVLTIE